jgi:hypothetical protein
MQFQLAKCRMYAMGRAEYQEVAQMLFPTQCSLVPLELLKVLGKERFAKIDSHIR